MPTRPESDRDLDAAIALRAVQEQLPALACGEARLIGSGWGTDAYLMDRRFVARFPRNAEGAGYVDQDWTVLQFVASQLGAFFAVPRVLHRGKAGAHFPYDFLVCEFVPGIAFDDPRAPVSDALASDLGRALTHIHSVPLAGALQAGLSQPDWDRYRGPLRFLHGDFKGGNLLLDPRSGRLTGVIDWGNAAVGDPALDFIGLASTRGWRFTQAVLDSYRAPVEDDLVARIRRGAEIDDAQLEC
jgi:aminoglycoside phosphotransferase (APT) family kinase protein